jgi:hypothetical protein
VKRALLSAFLAATLHSIGAIGAETPALSARLEPERLPAGGMTTLQIAISGNVRLKGSPDLALQNFQLVAGPSIENRFEWINGRSSSQTILIYHLRALKPGPASVGPIRISGAAGETLEAPQVTATVEKSGEPSGEARPGPVSSDPALVARLDPARPYAGQQAVWTLYLVTRGRATQGEIKSLPDFKGLWAEDLDRDPNVLPQVWNIAGTSWHAYPMIRKALFANRPGAISIGAARALIAVRADFFDVFGDSPFSESRPVEREAAPIAAVFRALPESGDRLPVGSFSLKSSVDRRDVAPGGSFSVTAVLSGDGRLADVAAPGLSIAGARISEPESRLSIRRSSQRLSSARSWQWVVTPEKPGILTVPAMRISTFNPVTGAVADVASPPMDVRTAGPLAPATPAAAPLLPAPAARSAFPSPAVLVPGIAAAALLLLAAGYRLGRARSPGPGPDRPEGTPEERIGSMLGALAAKASRRGGTAPGEIARLRDELARIAYSPQLSSRDEALEGLEAETLRLAKRWKARI